MIEVATQHLNELKRINFSELDQKFYDNVLLYPKNENIIYQKNDKILSERDKSNLKDLLRIIKIIDATDVIYENTKVLVPRLYAEKNMIIPQHISVQCLMFFRATANDLKKLKKIVKETKYDKVPSDNMWICNNKKLDSINEGDILYIMNRRVGGWDGSIERPVIELLCAGGHLPTIWDKKINGFRTLDFIELLSKEMKEEIGIKIDERQLVQLGGFHNQVSNELVILYCLFVNSSQLFRIIDFSKNNFKENINGVYIGEFNDVMTLYDLNPSIFAGGEKAKPFNFSDNKLLMKKIKKYINN